MILTQAHVTKYKSIDDASCVEIDPHTTVLVGQNESGKTVFLEAIHKAKPAENGVSYEVVEDYPRTGLNAYEEIHKTEPSVVAKFTYRLSGDEIVAINERFGAELLTSDFSFSRTVRMDGGSSISISVREKPVVEKRLETSGLSVELRQQLDSVHTLRELIKQLHAMDLNEQGQSFFTELSEEFSEPKPHSWNLLEYQIWVKCLRPSVPKFVYFDEYKLLPGKINLEQLSQCETAGKLSDQQKTVVGLLRLANIDLKNLVEDGGYERAKARLEGISNTISDQVFKYWTQNQTDGIQELEVQFDIKEDPADVVPFNTGKNLYIRIRSLRHRVSVSFDKRSRGFIWFFSFLVWFDSIKQQIGSDENLILLLDEPGISLHALAQEDLLRYIDELSKRHQVIYTTHSPFMVRSDRLHQVRTVEDRKKTGTLIRSNISQSDEKTLFPIQAALGYTIAQNLFIAKKNVLVEGPSDLIYLRFFSEMLKKEGRVGLADDVVVVPVGGLPNLATFVALLGANELEIVVLHDWGSRPEQRLEDLVCRKIIRRQRVIHYGMFKGGVKGAYDDDVDATDVEDLFSDSLYLSIFNAAYSVEMNENKLGVRDLARGSRMTERIGRTLSENGITVRPSGGFNHYRPALQLSAHPPTRNKIGDVVMSRFEALFVEINRMLV